MAQFARNALFLMLLLWWLLDTDSKVLKNSTLSCTRGRAQAPYILDCKAPRGQTATVLVQRVLYGAPLETSGCSRTGTYQQCCERDTTDCLFEDDRELESIRRDCATTSYCSFDGRSLYSDRGNCSSHYAYLTSYSFIEFECVNVGIMKHFCHDGIVAMGYELYLDSNYIMKVPGLTDRDCECIVSSDCASTLIFTAIDVVLKPQNDTHCSEELYFEDFTNKTMTKTIICVNETISPRDVLFQSDSNIAKVTLSIVGEHMGRVLLKVNSSNSSGEVQVRCGSTINLDVHPEHVCPGSETTPVSNKGGSVPQTPDEQEKRDSGEKSKVDSASSSSSIQAGAIAGIVLACIAILLVAILIVIFLALHKRRHSDDDHDDEFEHNYDNISSATDEPQHLYNNAGFDNGYNVVEDDLEDSALGATASVPNGDLNASEKKAPLPGPCVENPMFDNAMNEEKDGS